MGLIFRPWRRLLDFRGRAPRRELIVFYPGLLVAALLLLFASGLVLGTIDFAQGVRASKVTTRSVVDFEGALWLIVGAVGHMSLCVRRLHDQGKSGALSLLTLIPLLGAGVWLWLAVAPGTPGDNRFGPDPRGRAGSDDHALLAEVFR